MKTYITSNLYKYKNKCVTNEFKVKMTGLKATKLQRN